MGSDSAGRKTPVASSSSPGSQSWTRGGRIFGYELLYPHQEGPTDTAKPAVHGTYATAKVIDGLFAIGFDVPDQRRRGLHQRQPAAAARRRAPRFLPRDKVVGSNSGPTSRPTPKCSRPASELRKDGYLLAIDDFVPTPWTGPNWCRSRTTSRSTFCVPARATDAAAPRRYPAKGPTLVAKKRSRRPRSSTKRSWAATIYSRGSFWADRAIKV